MSTRSRASALAALLVAVAGCKANIPEGRFGCDVDDDCPPGQSCRGGVCFGEAMDAALSDAAALPDGSPRDDAGDIDAGPCAVCGAGEHCDVATGDCVACLVDSHCTNPLMPRCSGGSCSGCRELEHCARFEDRQVCAADGACVGCTQDSDCDGSACSLRTRTCTGTPARSVDACGACEADSECMDDALCVPLMFGGLPRASYHCLRRASAGCSRPYVQPVTKTSIDGVTASFCGFDENATTCEAIVALLVDTPCTMDADCGDGGLCRVVGGVADRCTIPCNAATDCPQTLSCTSSHCS